MLAPTLTTRDAAALLSVSPSTLRTWTQKYGFPQPVPETPGRRVYTESHIQALADALRSGRSVASAISTIQAAFGTELRALVPALVACRSDDIDAIVERSLALRSLERTIDDVLLPSLEQLTDRYGTASARVAWADRWACDWLSRLSRAMVRRDLSPTVVIGDGSSSLDDRNHVHTRALELCCLRVGLNPFVVPTTAYLHIRELVEELGARGVVASGPATDGVATWVYSARRASSIRSVFRYHPADQRAVVSPALLPASACLAANVLASSLRMRPVQASA